MKLDRRVAAALLFLSLVLPISTVDAVDGTHYGDGNLPAGCTADVVPDSSPPRFNDACYHMRTGLNNLDTPVIDVLLVTPASPYAERDLRQMRQAVESWRDGIEHLAPQMGLDWLADGVTFRIFLDNDAITTDPAWDPEIVVVLANPVLAGLQGIGIDPLGVRAPCRGANPLASIEAWNALPGFENHHGQGGTYVESCQGGGTTCYAVNLAIDPVPGATMGLAGMHTFWLVQHEFGHCLSVGHVGDAGDHKADAAPLGDIMAYTVTPHFKCVSSLDVEAFAIRMSRFLLDAPLVANDATGAGGAFQVQAPRDHFYASTTGLPEDCPVPNDGLVPFAEPVSWKPAGGTQRTPPTISIDSHEDGESVPAGIVTLAGTVAYGAAPAQDADGDGVVDADDNCPAAANTGQRDRDGDGAGDACDTDDAGFPVPDGTIRGNVVAFTQGVGPNNVLYSATNEVGDRHTRFLPGQPVTITSRATIADEGLVAINTSQFTWHIWDSASNLVLTAPCTTGADGAGFDCDAAISLPSEPGVYYTSAKLDGSDLWIQHHDGGILQARAPASRFEGLKAFEIVGALPTGVPGVPEHASVTTFQDAGTPANTFFPEDSTGTARSVLRVRPVDTTEWFSLRVTEPAHLTIRLAWSGPAGTGLDDLDLRVEGAAFVKAIGDSSSAEIVFPDARVGVYRIGVEPALITDTSGVVYTLTAELRSAEELDDDADGVSNANDACPGTPAGTPVDEEGCAVSAPVSERVVISIDGVVVATEEVDGRGGDGFSQELDLTGRSGTVEVVVTWYDGAYAVASDTVQLVVG